MSVLVLLIWHIQIIQVIWLQFRRVLRLSQHKNYKDRLKYHNFQQLINNNYQYLKWKCLYWAYLNARNIEYNWLALTDLHIQPKPPPQPPTHPWITFSQYISELISWLYLAISWQYLGNIKAISWQYLYNILAISWQYLGNILTIFWQYCGNILTIS